MDLTKFRITLPLLRPASGASFSLRGTLVPPSHGLGGPPKAMKTRGQPAPSPIAVVCCSPVFSGAPNSPANFPEADHASD